MTVRTGSRRGLSTPRESYAAIMKGFTLTRGLQSNGLHPIDLCQVSFFETREIHPVAGCEMVKELPPGLLDAGKSPLLFDQPPHRPAHGFHRRASNEHLGCRFILRSYRVILNKRYMDLHPEQLDLRIAPKRVGWNRRAITAFATRKGNDPWRAG